MLTDDALQQALSAGMGSSVAATEDGYEDDSGETGHQAVEDGYEDPGEAGTGDEDILNAQPQTPDTDFPEDW